MNEIVRPGLITFVGMRLFCWVYSAWHRVRCRGSVERVPAMTGMEKYDADNFEIETCNKCAYRSIWVVR